MKKTLVILECLGNNRKHVNPIVNKKVIFLYLILSLNLQNE
jgi:hypothetical protein